MKKHEVDLTARIMTLHPVRLSPAGTWLVTVNRHRQGTDLTVLRIFDRWRITPVNNRGRQVPQ
jgi:hypothetical protein